MTLRLFRNARIVTPKDEGSPAAGKNQGNVIRYDPGALIVNGGRIAGIGEEHAVLEGLPAREVHMEVDCKGRCLIPGFVDPHTHMCFARLREAEFDMRIGGMSYLDILRQGGGILSSVEAVRRESESGLYRGTRSRVVTALEHGTTTVEIKSGYGLDTDNELKMLRVIDRVARQTPLDVVPTFLGAHAIPPEYADTPDTFVDLIVNEMLPAVRDQGIAKHCDVFCEDGVFTIDQSRRILSAAKQLGMAVKLHADEIRDLGGAGLAGELNAVSADHVLAASDESIDKMARAGVIATLLPATAYCLRKPYARARTFIGRDVPVALATDCNPGSSYTESMPFVIGLAVLNMGLSPAEALTAATLNAAYALGLARRTGSLEEGKNADFLLLDGESPSILAYHAGVSPVRHVYKLGERIV